ncbi:hypothetical protein DICPUDRAFT_82227 [Dictyostelium purpureum]|uniref:Uncharacterized protein n=1 Tax=Dictyostelium purpureum TaxID=5786 RepID=F0ZVW5_DICPU|nr:uncharacterized protein DICPUDRAFT_82227 [Dictyostelium purpureum]EGC31916.1 hypothetical protein DICPUDRAFT_82227 [Dictyostelium purpureum]|eukprot:XP_003291553.1 hypothetical protein DICPUDRAFT_82227 [Dictyostelium purpureum]
MYSVKEENVDSVKVENDIAAKLVAAEQYIIKLVEENKRLNVEIKDISSKLNNSLALREEQNNLFNGEVGKVKLLKEMVEDLRLKCQSVPKFEPKVEQIIKKKSTLSTENVNELKMELKESVGGFINRSEFIFRDVNITKGADKLDQMINKVFYRESKWVKILKGLEDYRARMEREDTEPEWSEMCKIIRRKDDKVERREVVTSKLEKAKSGVNDEDDEIIP